MRSALSMSSARRGLAEVTPLARRFSQQEFLPGYEDLFFGVCTAAIYSRQRSRALGFIRSSEQRTRRSGRLVKFRNRKKLIGSDLKDSRESTREGQSPAGRNPRGFGERRGRREYGPARDGRAR